MKHAAFPRLMTIAGLCASGIAFDARAGGWPLPQGKGEIIVTASRLSADERYDSDGTKRWTSRYTKYEISSYAEYGFSDDLTLIGELAWTSEKTDFFGLEFEDDGFSRVKAGARYSIGAWKGTLFSIQPLMTLHLDDAGDDPAATKDGSVDAEIGIVLARNGELFGASIFSVQEAAWRFRDGDRPDQLRADIVLGGNPLPGTMLLLKSLNTASAKSTSTGELYRSSKLSFSVVQDIPASILPGVAVEAGLEQTIAGRSAIHDTIWRAAVWYRF